MTDSKRMVDILLFLEGLLSNGNFDKVDSYLDSVDLGTIGNVSIIAILSITYHGKDKLAKRDLFLERAEVFLKDNLGEERAENLLRWRR